MSTRIVAIAANTFREAVRDRVLYNLVVFALLMVASSLLIGQISIGVERLVTVNLGLAAITFFGAAIAIFIGVGLVSKEIEKRTIYTVLAHPVRRWEFILGKFFGLAGTLAVNAFLMAIGLLAAVLYVAKQLRSSDGWLLVAVYFIVLQLLILTALALLFSTFSSPLLSAVFALAMFIIGSLAQDLRDAAALMPGISRWVGVAVAYLVPNLSSMNVSSAVAHGHGLSGALIAWNTVYALLYAGAAVAGAVLIFERRNFK